MKHKSGFLSVNKIPGVTSHDTVLQARKKLNISKIGHSGTLDAPACGVLVLGVGKATRLLQFITALPKKYRAELILGKSTDTGDDTGKTINEKEIGDIHLDDLKEASKKFLGNIDQIPPMHSAKKVDGKRLYELAYEGKTIERKPHKVTIYKIEMDWLDEEKKIASMEVECSVGTYIRTLGSDIAEELAMPAHIRNLCRLSVGSFTLENAVSLDSLDSEISDSISDSHLISPASGMADYKSYILNNSADIDALQNGRSVPIENCVLGETGEVLNLETNACIALSSNKDSTKKEKELLAVCHIVDNQLRPKIVIPK